MNRRYIFILLLVTYSIICRSQKFCGFDKHFQELILANPNIINEINSLSSNLQTFKSSNSESTDEIVWIPVVFHVVHDGQPIGTGQNISDAQIQNQLAILNACYANSTSNSSALDTKIRFCLAKKDPFNQPTTGITRHSTFKSEWYIQTATYGDDRLQLTTPYAWPSLHYLNIWVANIKTQDDNNNPQLNDLSGYSSFAGIPDIFDGVLLHYKYCGAIGAANITNFDLGKTLVHEVGHWLGLFHTFEGAWDANDPDKTTTCNNLACNFDGDKICDTPPVVGHAWNDAYCQAHPTQRYDCNQAIVGAENYMEYNYDQYMKLFTPDQKAKMRLNLSFHRNYFYTNSLNNLANLAIECSPPPTSGGTSGNSTPYLNCNGTKYPDEWLRLNGIESPYVDLCEGTDPTFNLQTSNNCMKFRCHGVYVPCLAQTYGCEGNCATSQFCTQACELVGACKCCDYKRQIFISIWTGCDDNFNCSNEIQKWFTKNAVDQNLNIQQWTDVIFNSLHLLNENQKKKYIIKLATFDENGNWRSGQKYVTFVPVNQTFPIQPPNGQAFVTQKVSNELFFTANCIIPTNSEYIAGNQITLKDETKTNGLIESHFKIENLPCTSSSQRPENTNEDPVPEKIYTVEAINSNELDKLLKIQELNNRMASNDRVLVTPNPNAGNFVISTPKDEALTSIYIINTLGVIVQKMSITSSSNSIEVDIRDKPNGVYIVKVNCNGKTITKKIIKN